MARSQRQRVGDRYELAALRHLDAAGLELLARNYRCRMGEIDLIMRDKDVIVFVEVRYRRDCRFGGAAVSVSPQKMRRIERSAERYLQCNPRVRDCPARFDVVAIDGDPGAQDPGAVHVDWIKDAFRPGWF